MTSRRGGLGRGLGALLSSPDTETEQPARANTPPPPASGDEVPPLADRRPGPPSGRGDRSGPLAAGDSPRAASPAGDLATPGVVGAHLLEVELDEVVPNPRQPRSEFDEDALAELAASITAVGVLQPIVVRPRATGGYELVMGERRWRAARLAGLTTMAAIVRTTADDEMLRDALLENLQRQQLNPLEEAAAYQQLLEEFGSTHDQLASRLGRSRPQITNTLRLLQLPTGVQRRLAAGVLSAGHARALLTLPGAADQEALAARIVAEGLSVRAVEELVATHGHSRQRRRASVPRSVPAGAAEAAAALADWLDTRVGVEMRQRRGRLTVEFADEQDLERILHQLRAGKRADLSVEVTADVGAGPPAN